MLPSSASASVDLLCPGSETQLQPPSSLNLVPLFLGPPLGILTHLYSLRNLVANRARFARDRPAAEFQTEGLLLS